MPISLLLVVHCFYVVAKGNVTPAPAIPQYIDNLAGHIKKKSL